MYTEFIAATLEAQGQVDEDRILEAFDRLDVDNSGYISKSNMLDFLADTGASEQEIEQIIEGADTEEKDGQVSYEEFLAMFRTEDQTRNSSLLSGFSTFDLKKDISLDEGEETKTDKLIGVDAVIPGGKYDTNR
mmetsp:Transcript_2542/g.6118  ORF Transcript_2542/g.6118 Transcript_2542/m.6118 type:complete len:134 (+) Transcript_2542:1-402(+)